jgi:hypothetical protein
LFAVSTWLEGHEIDINRFPKVAALAQRMRQKASVQKVLALQ